MDEPVQDAQPDGAALLGVELAAQQAAVGHGSAEGVPAVEAVGQAVLGLRGIGGKGVDEVDAVSVAHVLQGRVLPGGAVGSLQRVPAHLGNLERPPVVVCVGDRPNGAGDQAQPLVLAELLAGGQQHLHTQADAEQGAPCLGRLADGFHQLPPPQFGHRVTECAHPGEDQRPAAANSSRVHGQHRLAPAVLDRTADAVQVAHAVVDDRDLHTRLTGRPAPRAYSRRVGRSNRR